MTDMIRAPWTPEQVDALNAFQRRGGMHPFTCGGDHTPGSPTLVAYTDGWRCPQPYGEHCGYRQDWAHAFMADPNAWPTSHPIRQYPDERRERAETDMLAVTSAAQATLTVTVTAPDPAHAVRWAGYIRDLVHAEHDGSMRLHSFIELEAGGVTSCSPGAEETEPNNPRTTPDNSPTSSDETDNPADSEGATPSQRPGLRDDIARAIHRYDNEHALSGNDLPSDIHRGEADAVLALLYREWPWLRAEVEELATLRAKVAEFDHIINWHTTCASCARILDSAYAETMRAEKAEAALREILDRLLPVHASGNVIGYEPPLPIEAATVDRWRAVLDEERPEPGVHVYLSTGCWHGDHAYCQAMAGLNGAKRPASCKKCEARCICPCHQQTGPPVHVGNGANAEDCPGPDTAAENPELTAEEARDLADELGTDLYRAQDALAFIEECCVIADREQRAITTVNVRKWLKGAQCGRQLGGGFVVDPAAPPLQFVTWTGPVVPRFTARPVTPEMERAATERARQAAAGSERSAAWFAATGGVIGGTAATEATDVGTEGRDQSAILLAAITAEAARRGVISIDGIRKIVKEQQP